MKKKLLLCGLIVMILGLLISYKSIKNIIDDVIIEKESVQDEEVKYEGKTEENKLIGNLEIRKIDLVGPIKEGSNSKVLKDYIGHIEETPIYNGNVCLAAHNRGNKYSYFSRLNELMEGDEIIYNNDIFSKRFRVNKIEEIDETDWTMLEDSSDNKLTLITCVKNKRDKRLCVQAVEI